MTVRDGIYKYLLYLSWSVLKLYVRLLYRLLSIDSSYGIVANLARV